MLVCIDFCSATVSVATPVLILLRQGQFLDAFYTIEEIDKIFKKLDIHFSFRLFHWLTLFMSFCCALFICLNQVYYCEVKNKPQLRQLVETLNYIGGWVLRQWPVYYYFTFIMILIIRMKFLNNRISKWNILDMSKEDKDKELLVVAKLHRKMCHVCDCLNATYSISLFSNILMTTVIMLIGIFTFSGWNAGRQYEIMFWVCCNLFPTWGIIFGCHYCSCESKQTGIVLSNVDVPLEDKERSLNVSTMYFG